MGVPVIIYGKSGSGKSRSLKNFGEEEILFFNIEKKMLPFKHSFKYTCCKDDMDTIKAQLKKMPLKAAVIDDAGYIMTHIFMKKHRIMKGNAQFDMYNEIADTMFDLLHFVKEELPEDVIVYIIFHEDTSEYGSTGLKTLGKLLDSKVCMEGMVTICLRCMSEDKKHFFRTVTDGSDITKTPEEMFEQEEIENDLKTVDMAIRTYYGWEDANEHKD